MTKKLEKLTLDKIDDNKRVAYEQLMLRLEKKK